MGALVPWSRALGPVQWSLALGPVQWSRALGPGPMVPGPGPGPWALGLCCHTITTRPCVAIPSRPIPVLPYHHDPSLCCHTITTHPCVAIPSRPIPVSPYRHDPMSTPYLHTTVRHAPDVRHAPTTRQPQEDWFGQPTHATHPHIVTREPM